MRWTVFITAWAVAGAVYGAELSPLYQEMNRKLSDLLKLEGESSAEINKLRAELTAAGGQRAVHVATEYQYTLDRELENRYYGTRPSDEELAKTAEELADLLESVARASSQAQALEHLDQAMMILLVDLDERFRTHRRLLSELRNEILQGDTFNLEIDVEGVSDRQILNYGFALTELELVLDAVNRLATLIGSYQGGWTELAARFDTTGQSAAVAAGPMAGRLQEP